MLLSTAYFPPVSWFALAAKDFTLSPDLAKSFDVFIDNCENYQKQSYRNRCHIYGASGVEILSYPIIHDTSKLITDIRIDYSTDRPAKIKRAIISAYMNSGYFEYYKDELFEIMDRKQKFLWDFNLEIIDFFLRKTGIKVNIVPINTFIPHDSGFPDDFRDVIHPKKKNYILDELNLKKPYFQVFERKYGFKPDLSIMDLLFNEGPDSVLFLKPVTDG